MSSINEDESLSDDDIFFGKITLKEVKRRLLWNNRFQSTSLSTTNSPKKSDDLNTSLKILQAHSEPNLLPSKNLEDQNSTDKLSSDRETKEDKCVSPDTDNFKNTEQLNNTLEVIEYILNNPPSNECKTETMFINKLESLETETKTDSEVVNELCMKKLQITSPQGNVNVEKAVTLPNSVLKIAKNCITDVEHETPVKLTPKTVFKTPAQTFSNKKPVSSLKKTPNKFNAYQHIASPIASYINNSPVVPLIRNVNPKKPLLGSSFIPKLKSHIPVKQSNKENVKLPQLAYKSAKETEVINLPDEQRLPQTQWAMKLMSSSSKPTVITHAHRDFNSAKKPLARKAVQPEDSIADLSVHQAEMSVCVQKSALKQKRRV